VDEALDLRGVAEVAVQIAEEHDVGVVFLHFAGGFLHPLLHTLPRPQRVEEDVRPVFGELCDLLVDVDLGVGVEVHVHA